MTKKTKTKTKTKTKLPKKIINKTTKHVLSFKNEFLEHLMIGLTAALGFLIALSWRTPIQKSVIALTKNMGFSENLIYFEYLAAMIMTIIAVIVFMIMAKIKVEGEEND